jgi:hypothetical protein
MVSVRKTYSPDQVKYALATYYSVRSFRKAYKITNVPRSALHGWSVRIGLCVLGKKKNKKRSARKEGSRKRRVNFSNKQQLSIASIHRALRAINVTYHKVSWRTPPRDVLVEKYAYWKAIEDMLLTSNIISIDEAGFLTTDLPSRGYGPKGQRLFAIKRTPKRFKVSAITAISRPGSQISYIREGNTTGKDFQDFVRTVFQSASVNSTALLDNRSFHKSLQVRTLAEEYGVRLLFTPPYSPECNPVENFFAAVKAVTRKAGVYNAGFFPEHGYGCH